MADPTDRDRERARELLSDGINAEAFERVAEALAAAREQGARDAYNAVERIIGEFGDDVHLCAGIIGEHIGRALDALGRAASGQGEGAKEEETER